MQAVTTIGLDIAKSVFQVHGVDAEGHVIIRRKLKRRYVAAFFQKLPPCLQLGAGRTDWGRKRPLVWGKRTCSGVTAERDQLSPESTVRTVIAVQKIRIATPHFNASLRLAAHENHEVGMISGLGANPFIRNDQR